MSLLAYFRSEMNRTFSLYPKDSGTTGYSPVEGFVSVATLTGIQSVYYEGSAAERLVSDRYKTLISGVCITDPSVSVPDGAKLVLDDDSVHYVIHADDVMTQGEILVIALSKEK